jgi:arsenite methyltransferase
MSDSFAALREMHRALKPGGRLGVAVWTQSPFGIFRQVVVEMGLGDDGPQPSLFGRDADELAEALRDVGFEDVKVQVRELVAVLEGGIPQALQVAVATSGGAVMASLSADRQQAVRDAIARALEPHVKVGAVHLRSAANIAAARTPR